MNKIRQEQLNMITGTCAAAILMEHPDYEQGPFWAQQKIQGNLPEITVTTPMLHGLIDEQPGGFHDQIAMDYYNLEPEPQVTVDGDAMFHVSPAHPFMGVHCDRFLGPDILEYKSTGVGKDWGAENYPERVYWQVAMQLLCIPERENGLIQAKVGHGDIRHYVLEREKAELNQMEDILCAWHEKHIQQGVPVDPETKGQCVTMWPKETDGALEITDPLSRELERLYHIRNSKKALSDGESEAVTALMRMMAEHEGVSAGGKMIIRWTHSEHTRIDTDAFKKGDPGLYNDLKERFPKVVSSRSFRPVWTAVERMFGKVKA